MYIHTVYTSDVQLSCVWWRRCLYRFAGHSRQFGNGLRDVLLKARNRSRTLPRRSSNLPSRSSSCEYMVVPVWSKNSCSITVVLQYAADALPTAYSASGFLVANFLWREQEDVTFPLVVSLAVKMINEVGERASQ